MSIPVLTQVYDEVRRLSIAGSVVAPGDFRLKKLVAPLEQSGQKAAVFARVAQAVAKVIESDERSSAEALLELSTLINAILYTQGETGFAGEMSDIQTTDLGQQQTRTSARVLKPLLEALTTTGSGRLEVIREAYELGVFRDLRLVGPALTALDDSYAEIGDFIAEKVLPLYGRAILSGLREKYDPKGRGGHVRRLRLMHNLDPEGTRELVQRGLDEGSKEIRVQAIECLGQNPDDLTFLLEQVKARSKEVRAAALRALGRCDAPEAVAALCAAIDGGDLAIAVAPVQASRAPELLKHLLKKAHSDFAGMTDNKQKDKSDLGGRLLLLLECLRGRDDQETEAFLIKAFQQRDRLNAVKGDAAGCHLWSCLVDIMACGPKKAQAALVDAHASLNGDDLPLAFVAACRSRPPADVFKTFSPYLLSQSDGKKQKGPAAARSQAIASVLIAGNQPDVDVAKSLDPRWLDLAVKQQNMELVHALARPGHTAANKLLAQVFEEQFTKSKHIHDLAGILSTLIRIEHPEATEAMVRSLNRYASDSVYGVSWVARLIVDLPKEAVPRLEALLPTLPEQVINDVLEYVTQLKNRK